MSRPASGTHAALSVSVVYNEKYWNITQKKKQKITACLISGTKTMKFPNHSFRDMMD